MVSNVLLMCVSDCWQPVDDSSTCPNAKVEALSNVPFVSFSTLRLVFNNRIQLKTAGK